MLKLIGRASEIDVLKEAINNNKSELIALYGRRRIGKTFLVRTFFSNRIVFEVAGLYKGSMADQLNNFAKNLATGNKKKRPQPIGLMHLPCWKNTCPGKKQPKRKLFSLMNFPGWQRPNQSF